MVAVRLSKSKYVDPQKKSCLTIFHDVWQNLRIEHQSHALCDEVRIRIRISKNKKQLIVKNHHYRHPYDNIHSFLQYS